MTNNEIYEGFIQKRGIKAHSFMGVILKSTEIEFIQKDLLDSLQHHPEIKLHNLQLKNSSFTDEILPILNLEWKVDIEYEGTLFTVYISIGKTRNIQVSQMVLDRGVSQMTIEEALDRPYFLFTKQVYSAKPLSSFLLQLKVMQAIAKDVLMVLDFSSNRVFSSEWLQTTCQTKIPPSPRSLYLVNIISDIADDGKKKYWLRTIGLYRCGAPELEIISVDNNVEQMSQLLHATANRFIQESFEEEQPIQIGYDGLDMVLCWQRWEEALKQYPNEALGGFKYREKPDSGYNKFRDPSGILFAIEEDLMISPQIYSKALGNDPLLYIDPKEKKRQFLMARERYSSFFNAYEEYGTKTFEDFPDIAYLSPTRANYKWTFIVRLDLERHENFKKQDEMWFEVMHIHHDEIRAKLITKTYWSKQYKKGDIVTASIIETLSYWIIITPDNTKYTPESTYLLESDL